MRYRLTFVYRGKRPTKSQIEYYLTYWLHENGEGITDLIVDVEPQLNQQDDVKNVARKP